jgi:cytochrome c oxidase assembly protein subunit 15
MTQDYNRALHCFAVFTAACTLLLLIAGGLVTSNDAGLAVPDWPLSYGSLLPPMVGGIFYEHGHRLVATFVGLLTVVLAVWLQRAEPRRWVRRLGWVALATVMAQGVLGGLTVLFYLPRPVSIAHATLAQTFFCITVSLALFTNRWWCAEHPAPPEPRRAPGEGGTSLRTLTAAAAASVFVQLVLGAGFRHQAWGILPHLVGAAAVAGLAFTTSAVIRRRFSSVAALRLGGRALHNLVAAQLVLGGGALWALLATRGAPQPQPVMVWTTVAHLALGALTLAACVVLLLCTFRLVRPAPSEAEGPAPGNDYAAAGPEPRGALGGGLR